MDFEREIMDLFISQVHRWRDVEFRFTGTIPYEPLCDLPKGAAPSLERLSLSMRRWPRELQYRAWEALTYGVPQLRDMNIFMTSGIHSIPTIPWDQLTYISMPVRMRCSSLFKILPKCSNVERIFIMPTGANPTSHSPILLPCLKSLHMDTGMEPGLLPMFRYLTAPLLEDFMINIPERIPTTHVGLLNGFLSRSDSKLQTLSFDSKETPIDVLMPFFTSPYLANLQDIWLGVHADENLIRALTPSDASEPAMWPLLTRIYIGPCDLGIDGLIASLLRSRADKIVRAVIRVLNKEHGYVKDREMVEKLQQSGISVSLEVEMEDNTSE
ncbi:hypothetical protein AX16_000717 [Volvariella volvacea WC 439]|nr:hypothetical protein AX16_000717 [Volvariella volvacea WC 439]